MNAGELTRLRQKAAIRYIARTNVTDSSLLTWKKQVGPTYADSGRPPVVGNYGINAGPGVRDFANGKSSDLPRGNALFDSKVTINHKDLGQHCAGLINNDFALIGDDSLLEDQRQRPVRVPCQATLH